MPAVTAVKIISKILTICKTLFYNMLGDTIVLCVYFYRLDEEGTFIILF